MLSNLRIQNFKLWKDTGPIRMAPITLFFGANSSGKSSIGQFLMMLKQTTEYPDRKAVFYAGGKNSAVQLGSFRDMVFHRDYDNKITFSYEWDFAENEIEIRDPITGNHFHGDSLSFSAEVGMAETDKQGLVVDYLDYKLTHEDSPSISFKMLKRNLAKNEYEIRSKGYKLIRNPGRVWYPAAPVRFYGFPDEVVSYHQNADAIQEFNLLHEKLFGSLYYLGPLRMKAERLYPWAGVDPESVGYSGENTIAAILASRNRNISFGYKKRLRPFEELIATSLKQMGLIDELHVRPISKEREEYEVKIRTKGSHDLVDLPDVGFGISQVLPVLVQCFYAPHDSIIIMEQPEIHLHPKAQAALADVFINAINSRENNKDRNIQLIVETHSEHFLRRLQRRIAEEKISSDKVSAYFAKVTINRSYLEPLEIDIFGGIQNWPENFFGDEIDDITKQSKAAMKKRKKLSDNKDDSD